MSSIFIRIKDKFVDLADWIQENLGDPAIASALRGDLGLAPGEDIPEAKSKQIQQFAKGFDPDKKAFAETVEELAPLVQAIIQLADQIGSDEVSGWDAAYLMGKVSASESIRARSTFFYGLGRLTLLISQDPDSLIEFDPALLVEIANGNESVLGDGEALLQRLQSLSLLALLFQSLEKFLGKDFIETYHGWDTPPDSLTPVADRVSALANTFILTDKDSNPAAQLMITLLAVPKEHKGPGLVVSVGGNFSVEKTIDNTSYQLNAGAASGLNLFIPFSDDEDTHDFEVKGDLNPYLKLGITRNPDSPDEPAIRIGDSDKTRLDIGAIGLGIDLTSTGAGVRGYIKEGALIVSLSEGDGFLQSLASGEIELGFDVGLTLDTLGGLRVDGGTLLQANLPVNQTLGGFLDIHHVDLSLGPSSSHYDMAFEISTAFGLSLGPFEASVDQIGFKFETAFREGNLGFMDADIGFKAPKGIGLSLDAGIVKGGGYLFIDHVRGEYAGALELKFASWGLKAIGVLSTKLPDGSKGFSLLLLIYADLPRFHIAFGIFFEGVGGIIGLQHGADINAIQTGIPSGVFDDVLFPANPVADAPRIINRLRLIFPVRAHAFLIGPMFKLTWGTPAVGEIKLGVILALDNIMGGDDPVSLSSILLVGQLRIGLPEAKNSKAARIICDFFGYLDFESQRFGFYARLRDSQLAGGLELTGSLILQMDFGDNPTFVLAVGGFHPRFNDLPANLPAALDRVGLKFNIGIVKITVTCYLAVTSATVQFGANLALKVTLGPVRIEGGLGFDALIYYEPYFRFELDFHAGVKVKYKSYTLMAVEVRGILSGPGLWHVTGTFTFSILFWDIDKSFDEAWGDRPAIEATLTSVSSLLLSAYNNPDNWSISLPFGSDTLVTLSAIKGETDLIVHPLGQLRVSQKIAPLGLRLEKFGETGISGATKFDLIQVSIGNTTIANPDMTQEHLARANFIELSEEDRLSKPSFENFDVGISVGMDAYSVPENGVTEGDLSYETKYLKPATVSFLDLLVLYVLPVDKIHNRKVANVDYYTVANQAKLGAAASSKLRQMGRFVSEDVRKIKLKQPTLSIVDDKKLSNRNTLHDLETTNTTMAQQRLDAMNDDSNQLVEIFELNH